MASLYIHIPFCERKCIYCDFYSIAIADQEGPKRSLTGSFLDALRTEIKLRAEDARFRVPVETIFFGGGTPSLLDPGEIESLLNLVLSSFTVQPNAEITLETNPGTVDRKKLDSFRSAGINRLSLGIQSFDENELNFLTRIHTASDAKKCIKEALAAGFENISFDLIFSLPGQTLKKWSANLEQAMEFSPAHISAYSLILEPQTPLFEMVQSKKVILPDDDRAAEMYEFTIDFLTSRRYGQYEISNFARKGYECRHNMNYWNHSGYLGFGPSAHSYWPNDRWWNISDIGAYIKKMSEHIFPLSGGENLDEPQLIEETIFLGLRSQGIDIESFKIRFKRDFIKEHEADIKDLIDKGYANLEEGKFKLTAKGYVICDEICQSFR